MAGAAALFAGGCATQYRPVVAAINPVGPAGQPQKYAYVVSNPNGSNTTGTLSGLLNVIDFSGDTIISTPSVIPNPSYFAENFGGSQVYIVNPQNSLDSIPVSSPNSLIASQIVQTTLPTGFTAPTISAITLGGTPRILIPQVPATAGGSGSVAIFSASSPALQQQISVPGTPVYTVGYDATPRAYVLSTGATAGSVGQASAIEASSLSISASIPVGVNPTYGVETTDNRRAFVLNTGSGSISVINVVNNATDNANPVINLNNVNGNGITGLQPVWADLALATNQLIVVSQRPGDANGYLSIVNIPLCNAVAQPSNPSCDPTNPVDGVGFGQVLATVPVGINPVQVAVLEDGSQAYVANAGDLKASPEIEGSVTAVNLVSGTVTATITGASSTAFNATPVCSVTAVATGATNACVYGHPNSIAATTGTPTGKVYVTSPDSNFLTVIETDTDSVDTHVNLQGAGLRVVVSAR